MANKKIYNLKPITKGRYMGCMVYCLGIYDSYFCFLLSQKIYKIKYYEE